MTDDGERQPERDSSPNDGPSRDEWRMATLRGRRRRSRHFAGCAAAIRVTTRTNRLRSQWPISQAESRRRSSGRPPE